MQNTGVSRSFQLFYKFICGGAHFQIDNYKGARFKKFSTQLEAQQFVDGTWVKPTADDEEGDKVVSKKRSSGGDDDK